MCVCMYVMYEGRQDFVMIGWTNLNRVRVRVGSGLGLGLGLG